MYYIDYIINQSGLQKSPSEGTSCDIIYQDKIEANINIAYGSSTVSFLITFKWEAC